MERILIVESDALTRQLMNTVLLHLHYDVVTVESGPALFNLLGQDSTFSLVILDISLYQPERLDLLGMLKSQYPALPVIVMTTHPAMHQEALAKGSGHCVIKPFQVESISQSIQNMLC